MTHNSSAAFAVERPNNAMAAKTDKTTTALLIVFLLNL